MRLTFLIYLVVAACSASTAFQIDIGQTKEAQHDYKGWKEYAPKEPAFAVKFPEEPVVETASETTENFHVAVASIRGQGTNDLGYDCQWRIIQEKPYSSKAAEAAYLHAYLRGTQTGALRASQGKLVDEKDLSLGAFQGREFTIELTDRNLLRTRVYVAGKRVIVLQVRGKDKAAISSDDPAKFFDSLRISK